MTAENCPKSCKHRGFHYCGASGTHCDKHCICGCHLCVAEAASLASKKVKRSKAKRKPRAENISTDPWKDPQPWAEHHHTKVYSGECFLTRTPSYIWICSTCLETGEDKFEHLPSTDKKLFDSLQVILSNVEQRLRANR